MQGNYRHHYMVQASAQSNHRQQTMAMNGLPASSSTSARGVNYPAQEFASTNLVSYRARSQPMSEQSERQSALRHPTASRGDLCAQQAPESSSGDPINDSMPSQLTCNNNKQSNFNQIHDKQQHNLSSSYQREQADYAACLAQQEDQYASQIRNNQLQSRFNHNYTYANHQAAPMQSARPQNVAGSSCNRQAPRQQQQRKELAKTAATDERPLHVNFNRSGSQSSELEEPAEGRKKKYLTAKYGQQQMNLIKKRLKIEMWLYEQLQELAKGTKSEVSPA